MIRQISTFVAALALALAFSAGAFAQAFTSGSTGADGAYNATVSGDFDPNNILLTCPSCTSNTVDSAGDNVFNFTTITVASGVSLRLRASKVRNMPVVWLATGNVTINGILNLTGDGGYSLNATDQSQIIQNRRPAEPGAGGYYGGLGSRGGVGPETGAGPGGGAAGANTNTTTCYGGTGASYTAVESVTYYNPNGLGQAYGNLYLVPLYGGSGGGGGWGSNVNDVGGGGGAGGGAIRIVSTTQITITSPGNINASGGASGSVTNDGTYCNGGAGAAGAIHLIAPTVTGNGSLFITQGSQVNYGGSVDGYVRFNTSNYTFTGSVSGVCSSSSCTSNTYNNAFVGPLYNVPPNSTLAQPSITFTSINGVNVPQPPAAQYLNPDVQINTNSPVNVNIAAVNVPTGTVVTLRVTSETAGDAAIPCAPLAGSLASSTATCSATFPFSVSIATLRATW